MNSEIFNSSFSSSFREQKNINAITLSSLEIGDKVKNIVLTKDQERKALLLEYGEELKDTFDVTGSIKFEPDIIKNRLLCFSQEVRDFIDKITSNYCTISGKYAIFRNSKYYFQFDSLSIEGIGPLQSINNYEITNINILKFREELLSYLNSLNQDIDCFISTLYTPNLLNILKVKKSNIFLELKELFSEEVIEYIDKKIKNNNQKENNLNNQINKQDNESKELIDKILEFINSYEESKTEEEGIEALKNILIHITGNTQIISYIKNTFNLDIREVFSKNLGINIDSELQKIYLGLLDTRINIHVFLQNISQIILNENFMNSESKGKLVLNPSLIGRIKKYCKVDFEDFRKKQLDLIKNQKIARLYSIDIDSLINNYINILINNDSLSYLEAYLTSINAWDDKPINSEEQIFDLLEDLFSLIGKLSDANDREYIKKQNNPKNNNKQIIRNNDDNVSFSLIYNKTFRLFREEDDPLTMIKTAQNTYLDLCDKGFNLDEVLHIMSVNYGGSSVGYYIKAVYAILAGNNKTYINSANLIYSIHDLKNANNFSNIVDYPFIEFLGDGSFNSKSKILKNKKHWLLIFDDNTSTGTTLGNIRSLAIDINFFDNIEIYPCRANINHEGFRRGQISDYDILNMIGNSGYKAKRSYIKQEEKEQNPKFTYKEKLGTIIGHRIYKQKCSK